MTLNLFDSRVESRQERLGPGPVVLRGFATASAAALLAALQDVSAKAPFRHMVTPGGFRMSGQKSVSGSLNGSPAMTLAMLEFASRHKIAPQVEHFPMSKVKDALEHLAAGRARYRVVLDPDFA